MKRICWSACARWVLRYKNMDIIINGAGGRMGRALRAMLEKKGAKAAALIDPFV